MERERRRGGGWEADGEVGDVRVGDDRAAGVSCADSVVSVCSFFGVVEEEMKPVK